MSNSEDSEPNSDKCEVDFQFEKNNKEHRTDQISKRRLIVRRGQCFNIKVKFTDGFNPENNKLQLVFDMGSEPQKSNGTKIEVPLTDSINAKRWSGIISSSTSSELHLTISPSPKAKIGYYHFTLQHCYQDVQYYLGNFVVLFNPWCAEDEVFLDNDAKRDEYVMNETGIIYVGSSYYISDRSWNFGQFEEDILDICIKLLNNTPNLNESLKERGCPVHVSRIVSAMVNCIDDNGIIYGNWSGSYDFGVPPGKWNGSVQILRKWNKLGCKPVRYGQCWVFAAVTCTVLRCLGIPTRVVTNFDSAHDTNANLTIDEYWNVEGESVGESDDSIWNFHVWNECWMLRNDLQPGYDGWQAVDATPQEKSEGIYCCGPASVKAIREGVVDMNYDAPFVFAEVNANCVNWLVFENGEKMKLDSRRSRVGHNISTKKCGSNEREDVTSHYKYPDGSMEEACIFKKANRIQNIAVPDKTLGLSMTTNMPAYYGKPVAVSMIVSNKTSEEKSCNLRFWAKRRRYTGHTEKCCFKKFKKEITVGPNKDMEIPLKIDYKEYGSFPDTYNMMKLMSMVTEAKSNACASAITDISLINPSIIIKVLNYDITVNKEVSLEINLQNTTPETLKNCVLTLEGVGLIKDELEVKFSDILPNQKAKVNCKIVPYKTGKKKLLVDFDCDKTISMKGSLDINVKEQ
ncbi:protein-glutamine gamma-glutamyltransferase 2-like [Hemiscyllium ocellatum]|uniref:protein-glutamine gamma-glutamyltransferase 2-like n=1 Tax=Hemiscyllium ocellatum TaxID=170820 RepID=UPI002967721F|nr:protein-glutamine gamma-glutamyltransferase 2-like [Hemiscyllium ocellatum]